MIKLIFNRMTMHGKIVGCCSLFAILVSNSALGQFGSGSIPMDITGLWTVAYHEDWIEVGEGPLPGNFTGLPVNDAARQRGLSWSPYLPNMKERQCTPAPLEYGVFWTDFSIREEFDPISRDLVAYVILKEWGGGEQTVYMDGRPRPPEYAPHTWQGFSKGEWVGKHLKVTTTHLKEGWTRRNGIFRSDQATIVQYFTRHDDHLTIVRAINDPVYLTEPLIHTTNFTLNLYKRLGAWVCEYQDELAKEQGYVPHFYYWKNPLLDVFREEYGVSEEVSLGGAYQMYPEFIE